MSSSLRQWEADSLFSAAQVVRDSADRMDSIFGLLLHKQSLLHGDRADPRLLKSIELHRRDLTTLLETTRWQLEDFERAVDSLAVKNGPGQEDVIIRHKQFISAIKEHIINVEDNLQDPSYGCALENSQWVCLNEQDRNMLAFFLSGGHTSEQCKHDGIDDSILLRRLLDSPSKNGLSNGTSETIQHKDREMESISINRVLDRSHDFAVNKIRNMVSDTHISARSGFDVQDFLLEIPCEGHDHVGSWDMEAHEIKSKTFFRKSQHYRRWKFFQFLNILRNVFGYQITRNYIKRLKDGEEQRNSPSYADASYASQERLVAVLKRNFWARSWKIKSFSYVGHISTPHYGI